MRTFKELFAEAEQLRQDGKLKDAIELYQQTLKLKSMRNRQIADVKHKIAVCFLDLGQPEAAMHYLEDVFLLRDHMVHACLLVDRGRALLQLADRYRENGINELIAAKATSEEGSVAHQRADQLLDTAIGKTGRGRAKQSPGR